MPYMTIYASKAVVTGRVQGVGYRAWTQDTARASGLRGWVRNQPDGSVQALLAGDEDAVKAVQRALWQGPPAARVDNVAVFESPAPDGTGFEITG